MNFIKKYYLYITTLWGAILGYVFLHPFTHIIIKLFHAHEEDHIHLHWNEIITTFINSFHLKYWPHILSYSILSGIIGYLYGRKVKGYELIKEHLFKFSQIGVNASRIVHDLNNPLTGVIGHTQLLKMEIQDPKQITRCEKIEKEAKRISKMIMDINTTARGIKSTALSKTSTNLKSLLENIISKMTLHCKVSIIPKFEGQISIDSNEFERVLWNLIKNADEALEVTEDGRIEISLTESDGFVTICISDNGAGIPKKVLKNLFKFGQTFGKKGGTGIGLYNSKRIVEAHGGKIWVESKVGRGTNVYIKIPK